MSAFARTLEMPQNTVDCYIKGRRKPSVELILRVCTRFHVSADWLLGLTDVRAVQTSCNPVAPRAPVGESFGQNPDLAQRIRALESRIRALESQPTFACG